jgi:hypothetical protein
MKEVKWLNEMLHRVEAGKEIARKQDGREKFSVELSDNGRFFQAYNWGTLILHLDLHDRKILSVGGAFSVSDANYVNNILSYYNMYGENDLFARCGSAIGFGLWKYVDGKTKPVEVKLNNKGEVTDELYV